LTRSSGAAQGDRTLDRGARLLAAVAALVVVDASWLLLARARGAPRQDEFARSTCGPGAGVATAPDWSFHDVDPRLAGGCESETFPLPGLACPDPNHGTGVAALPDRR
jgi:hypothetical protein